MVRRFGTRLRIRLLLVWLVIFVLQFVTIRAQRQHLLRLIGALRELLQSQSVVGKIKFDKELLEDVRTYQAVFVCNRSPIENFDRAVLKLQPANLYRGS